MPLIIYDITRAVNDHIIYLDTFLYKENQSSQRLYQQPSSSSYH
jgi:hypothetical protein